MTNQPPDLELLQFRYSPYNEKARWALALKGLAHARRSLLPGPHAGPVRTLTGQTATPVLVIDGAPVAGSARIVEALDRLAPEPRLIPEDDSERTKALAIEARFDDDLTPRMRRAVLAILIDEPGYMCRCFAGDAPPLARAVYRAAVPFAGARSRAATASTVRRASRTGARRRKMRSTSSRRKPLRPAIWPATGSRLPI